jgi:predicted nucleic acid-binding protein
LAVQVVCNTTPLNYLIQLGLAELLPRFFGEVLIPMAVVEELSHTAAPLMVREWIKAPPGWLRIEDTVESDSADFIEIHRGEIAAILLAEQVRAEFIIMDDAGARAVALSRGLRLAGTLGVLRDGAKLGLLNDLSETLARLRGLGFHISEALFEQLTKQQ